MIRRLLVPAAVAALLLIAAPDASARSLYWRSMDVQARLDADGRLHVSERLDMVFSGAWNGGERRFHIAPGQELTLQGVTRFDPKSGAELPLAHGDLSEVDQFSLVEPDLLRWRSRLSSDPIFSHQDLTYTIDYTLSGILKKSGSGYRLDHDFSFPDRDGVIDRFTLDLTLDPVWRPKESLSRHLEAGPLRPGSGYVVTADLLYSGSGAPAAIWKAPLGLERVLAGLLVLLGLLLLGGWYLRHEKRRGRFAPLFADSAIDRAWLEQNLFRLRPEEAAAAWADEVGADAVAALLSRLVAEGKLESETIAGLRPSLRLTLRAPRADFQGYERRLIDQLFFENTTTITPKELRKYYQSSGFDPSKIIRDDLKARLDSEAGFSDHLPAPSGHPIKVLLTLGLLLDAAAALFGPPVDWSDLKGLFMLEIVCAILGLLLTSRASETFRPFSSFLLGAIGLCLVPFLAVTLVFSPSYSLLFLLAVTVTTLGLLAAAFNLAVSRDGPARLESRRRVAAARRFFMEELRRPQPRLEDSWYPYLIAFGLGRRIDAWSRGFAATATSTFVAAGLAGSAAAASSSGWSGGGGRFGGAGASASWASAVGGFSSGVSAPSSGGGGGSSGGGGGGGW